MEKKDYFGHRERLRNRYIESGYKSLNDYEVIELLLTFVRPRVDTKPIAKKLLNKYGTLENIFKADKKELLNFSGLGEKSSFFLKFIGDISAYSFQEKVRKNKVSLKNKREVINYLRNTIGFSKNEKFKVLFLNVLNEIIEIENLFEGTIDKSTIYPRKILERALYYNARNIIFVHNHPSGKVSPSEKDIEFTRDMKDFFKIVDINVIDHIIITENSYFSFLEKGII